jgi:hypothetical protein
MRQAILWVMAFGLLTTAATAQVGLLWGDDFDNLGTVGSPPGPYPPGPVGTFGNSSGGINNPANGAWDAWYQNSAADAGISTTVFRSLPQSLEVGGAGVAASGCDIVQWHSQATNTTNNPGMYNQAAFPAGTWPQSQAAGGIGGVWQYRAWNFCPSSMPTGTSSHYFIVNDTYTNSTATWIMQVQFNHLTGIVKDDHRAILSSSPVSIVYDQWVELVATFDLDNDCASVTYNGANIGQGPIAVTGWNPGTNSAQIANLDLFTIGATSYWDDITLSRIGTGPSYAVNNANAPGPGQGISASINATGSLPTPLGTSCAAATTVVTAGTAVSIDLDIPFASPGYEAIIDLGPAPAAGAGGFTAFPGFVVNVGFPGISPTAFWLFGGGNSPLLMPYPGGASTLVSFFVPPPPLTATIQFFTIDPINIFGISASQPCTLVVQ